MDYIVLPHRPMSCRLFLFRNRDDERMSFDGSRAKQSVEVLRTVSY